MSWTTELKLLTAFLAWFTGSNVLAATELAMNPDLDVDHWAVAWKVMARSGPLVVASATIVHLWFERKDFGAILFPAAGILVAAAYASQWLAGWGVGREVALMRPAGNPKGWFVLQLVNFFEAYGNIDAIAGILLGSWTGYRIAFPPPPPELPRV